MESFIELGNIIQLNNWWRKNEAKRLMIDAAHYFEDHELVTFIEKYYESEWFCYTRQYHNAKWHIKFQNLTDINIKALGYFIILGVSPPCIKYLIQRGADAGMAITTL